MTLFTDHCSPLEFQQQVIEIDPYKFFGYKEDFTRAPIVFACAHGLKRVVQYLLSSDADACRTDRSGLTALRCCFAYLKSVRKSSLASSYLMVLILTLFQSALSTFQHTA